MPDSRSVDEVRAEAILAGQFASPKEILALVNVLQKSRQFGLARKLLEQLSRVPEVAGDTAQRLVVGQKLALSTYKDPDLQPEVRLEQALDTLRRVDDLRATRNQETLGLAGSIHKRSWELSGRQRDLEIGCAFYIRGYREGVAADFGYTAINAAFVLDLLADLETPDEAKAPAVTDSSAQRIRDAAEIRRAVISTLPALALQAEHSWLNTTWWFLVTLGEAYFGLADFANAGIWLNRAAALEDVADWERESTARQLAMLMHLMERRPQSGTAETAQSARQVLREFLGSAEPALHSVLLGKIGLALSGGGFRASLYHVGVLARLAELDLLRHVEYLSCVSGGSIIGAHYYLEVRRLLTSKRDDQITRDDYIDVVERVCRDLLSGIQRNIRTRIAAEWLTNIKMIFAPDYSRTKRAGELYESEIYSRVQDGEGNAPRWLNDLKIVPQGESPSFRPKDNNWRRAAKVPILVLNATSLNTGHNWQFTASWMGEPPAGIDSQVDANYRLRRMYYEQAPEPHRRIRLGYAVAASACVPGLFEPLPMANLYERPADSSGKVRPVVRLVDGGVQDNQGTAALLEQGCSVLLVSDASGQMNQEDSPSNGILGVPLRSNSILQARVRVSQFEDLDSRRRGGALKGLMFVHLKKDLDVQPVDWIDCQDPSSPSPRTALTSYGIQKGIQRRLAAIRTDLDSFSEVEAYALMTSGYAMTETALKRSILGFPVADAPRSPWPFLHIEPLLQQPSTASAANQLVDRQLHAASKLAFKIWLLNRGLKIIAAVVVLGALVLAASAWRDVLNTEVFNLAPTVGGLLFAALTLAASVSGLALISRVLDYRKTLREILMGLLMATIGFLFARLHLHVFDPLFLRQGRLSRVLELWKQR